MTTKQWSRKMRSQHDLQNGIRRTKTTPYGNHTHDGLCSVVQNELHKDPFDGTVFVFRSKRMDRLKLVYWDGSGLVMAYKRLEDSRFVWPPVRDGIMSLSAAQFEVLFAGLDWRKVNALEARQPAAAE